MFSVGRPSSAPGPRGSHFESARRWQRATVTAWCDRGGSSRHRQLSFAARLESGPWHGGMSIAKDKFSHCSSRSVQRGQQGSETAADEYADVDVRAILSDPAIEGDPLKFLKVTEAYWSVRLPTPTPLRGRPVTSKLPCRDSCPSRALDPHTLVAAGS